jgi:hypothetical protein
VTASRGAEISVHCEGEREREVGDAKRREEKGEIEREWLRVYRDHQR